MRKKHKRNNNVTRDEISRAFEIEREENTYQKEFGYNWNQYSRTIDLDDFQSHYCKTWAEKEYEIHDIIGMTLFYGNGEIHDISRKDNLLTMSYTTTTELNLEICDELSMHGVSIKEYEYWRYRY